jgi:phage tail protein X
MQVRAQAGDTVDAVCWRHVGRTQGVTEAVLNANPGLAGIGVTLPAGHPIEIPDTVATVRTETRTLKLWD